MIITRTVECIPDLKNIEDGLLDRFRKKFEYTCSKTHGFILKVVRIVRINTCKISIYNGNTIVECDIDVECLLPEVGQRLNSVVKQVYPQGLIVTVQECMKVFVPAQPGLSRNAGELLDVNLTQIRFQKGKYDCIALPS